MTILISAFIQLFIFTVIPFLWWLIVNKRREPFLSWIGLKKPIIDHKKQWWITFVATLLLLCGPLFFVLTMRIDTEAVAASQFAGLGAKAIIPSLIFSYLQTGLSEEILFRGFIGKRCIRAFGFAKGNFIQATCFGLVHGLMFVFLTDVTGTILITVITGIAGWLMGWINEKLSKGSIVSSWLLHGSTNMIPSVLIMFSIIGAN
ncbi:CPBP family intramembrane glutamic endopeptidase [Bacillus norwichensis]|uniref:CPBP family intramembrane metalloprotease n=1 Tax=Bacillus norwichensis TaxID=2762217 RepID=A0ABR8VN99_9BACI|nr:CPBP family intramembrane glutamic endopeptidase [Bacillus norwichensis]MBD8006240.1 CPBP family intramembrane metalloprotease [Bacillus norwichensis]